MSGLGNTEYVKDENGATFIAATQRPDGTWRKPRRVRNGYVPQEEVPLYESKGKQFAKARASTGYPVGYSPDESKDKSKSKRNPIPGLIVAAPSEGKQSKKKNVQSADTLPAAIATVSIKEGSNKKLNKKDKSTDQTSRKVNSSEKLKSEKDQQADPVKRLKNLRKKVREIEALEEKIASGELKAPEKEQLEKVARKKEVMAEISRISALIDST